MVRLVEVSDQEVCIDFALHRKCRSIVRLTSLVTNTPVAFKVQTSSPQKFLVNPPSGLIPPSSCTTFQIILKPQTQPPPTFPRSPSDRFLIKTVLAPDFTHDSPVSTRPNSINSFFSSRPTHDIKLKVVFMGRFLLCHAVTTGKIGAVKNIINRQKSIVSELPPGEAESLLKIATELEKSEEMTNLLLESGLKIDSIAELESVNYEMEGIHAAAALDRRDELLSLLKNREGRSLDCRDKKGRTALHLAASKGNIRCAMMLLEAGVDMDARRNDGRTALYRATEKGNRPMIKLLIENGADPTIGTSDHGRTPVDIARDKGHKEIVEILERGELVLGAARRGQLKQLESLLQKGGSTKYCDQYGLTALHAAAVRGHKDVVTMLLEYGMDLECPDSEGHAPLHLAVEGGNIETVEVLINRGANINASESMEKLVRWSAEKSTAFYKQQLRDMEEAKKGADRSEEGGDELGNRGRGAKVGEEDGDELALRGKRAKVSEQEWKVAGYGPWKRRIKKSRIPPELFLRAAVRPFTYKNLVKEIVLTRHAILEGEIGRKE